jgi:salicylate hydroxylase
MAGVLQDRPVIIVGGGIAGLTTALSLSRRGARVTVIEQAPELREVGAGLQLSPNGTRVLHALGLHDALERVSLRSRAVVLRDEAGRQVVRLDLLAHRPREDFRLIHRARLIGILAATCAAQGVTIRLGEQVEDLPDAPLLIGADGLHSRVRRALNGCEVPFFTGQVAWRALVPCGADAVPEAQVFMGPGRHLVSYPLGQGLRNIVAVLETRDWQDEGWSLPDDPENMRRAFGAFAAPVTDWLGEVHQVYKWGLFRHSVATRWQDGRRVILGDAAHSTLPFQAQGAVMAIEDAAVLTACLDADPDQTAALARFESLRKPRTARIVEAANRNARNYHLSGPKRLVGHALLRAAGQMAPGRLLSQFDWIYDHDALTAAGGTVRLTMKKSPA